MKTSVTLILVLFSFVLFGNGVYAQSDSINDVAYDECIDIERFDATFEGGIDKFRNWIYDELLKVDVVSKFTTLTATIKFVISSDGSVSDIEIVSINQPNLSEQLTNIILRSPKWKPSGTSVDGSMKYRRRRCELPITIEFK